MPEEDKPESDELDKAILDALLRAREEIETARELSYSEFPVRYPREMYALLSVDEYLETVIQSIELDSPPLHPSLTRETYVRRKQLEHLIQFARCHQWNGSVHSRRDPPGWERRKRSVGEV
ncbi:hypothetical protein [Halobellus limi]|uniref:Uncharacterized protein n=1 Tax=Halobellus limi TaxID=699433 RepID=A0A1H6ARA1_9EURY|nr:hypothetical protein [Halobellus limi]QCC47676.1 hypothetical protein DV707_08395 [Halobellus limi]SEG50306.1 hypothetical protein SAMN04488133_2422 [Halobellus limi]